VDDTNYFHWAIYFPILFSHLVTFCVLIITFYQRTLLGTSANQKRHYLKSYNKFYCSINKLSISVNTRINQPMEPDIHLGCHGEYHVPRVDQSLYSPHSTLVTFCALNITFHQRTLLGTSVNQKRHYLEKSYNKGASQLS
jgi:hypothetical protein